jgi:hypothetical protein
MSDSNEPWRYWRVGPLHVTRLSGLTWIGLHVAKRSYTVCFGRGVPGKASRLMITTPTRGSACYGKFALPMRFAIRHLFS